MKWLLLILSFFVFERCFASDADHRIVNGSDAREGEFKFAVSLRRNGRHHCGATILNESTILTAAHCVCADSYPQNATLFSIQWGLATLPEDLTNVIQVSEITCPLFSSTLLIWDVAVAKLETPLPTNSSKWERVTLATKFNISVSQTGVIIGWGRTSHGGNLSSVLQKLDVKIYPETVCSKYPYYMSPHHVCFGAENAGACNGDSGTALLLNGAQIGIASFITANCGIANEQTPNFYSRVDSYYGWINKAEYCRIDYLLVLGFVTALMYFN